MEVKPITQEMLLTFFADGNYHYSVNPSGLYAIHFSYTESIDCETHYTFLIEGKANDLVSVRGHCDHRYKTEKLAPLLISLNEYKNQYRWPKMTVSESNNRLYVTTELDLDVEAGIHQELLNGFLSLHMSSSHDLWKWLAEHEI